MAERWNNWEHLSFDVGPTLMRWMRLEAPQVHDGIVAADRASVRSRGHGNALAQGYHHAILPLCNDRDRKTEIRWGIVDFQVRFGRKPEGLWLPECAVDIPTLCDAVDEGIQFVVLAPEQADTDRLDPHRAYRVELPEGRSIAAFFYAPEPARGVAFDGWLHNGVDMAHKLAQGTGLIHLATDGESYGHHHRHGEMALAACLKTLGELGVQTTNYAAWLAEHPPTETLGIVEPSSWSCSHGVGRWSRDCGCGTEQGHGDWREALRNELNGLRDQIDAETIPRIEAFGVEPWAFRDQYILHLLAEEGFAVEDPLAGADPQLIRLLRIQEFRLMMFTSCGWFFANPNSIETLQIRAYADHAKALLRQI